MDEVELEDGTYYYTPPPDPRQMQGVRSSPGRS